MNQTKPFTILLFAILLINACGKEGCPDSKPIEKGVDKSYLPYIIPYSDTSTRLFLKNGTDTLLFKSQGLKETKISESASEGNCDKYNLQQYSLKMVASDTDFFQINYYALKNTAASVYYNINFNKTDEVYSARYINFFQLKQFSILSNKYDSVSISPNRFGDTVYTNLKFGILKFKDTNNFYELIK